MEIHLNQHFENVHSEVTIGTYTVTNRDAIQFYLIGFNTGDAF